jgi:hypothetical protein
MLLVGGQCPRTYNDHVSDGTQKAHHQSILLVEATDIPTVCVPAHLQRDDPIQGRYEIAEDVRTRAGLRQAKTAI